MILISKIKLPKYSVLAAILLVSGFSIVKPITAFGKDLRIENYGIDSTVCGSKETPCRSISKAILNANVRDNLIVGPGRYGDLNGDGDFDDQGEEAASFCGNSPVPVVICVNKRLRIISSYGAEVTIIDAGNADVSVVSITAKKVIFGIEKKGFTITRAKRHGVNVELTTNVTIDSNVVTNVGGNSPLIYSGIHIYNNTGWVKVINNVVRNSHQGFDILGLDNSRVHLLSNIASNNQRNGFYISGNARHIVHNNSSINNDHGIVIFGDGYSLRGNAVIGNTGYGFYIENSNVYGTTNSNHQFTNNIVIANRTAGFYFNTDGVNNVVSKNNIFSNGDPTSLLARISCSLLNPLNQLIIATKNFWGRVGGTYKNAYCKTSSGFVLNNAENTIIKPFKNKPIFYQKFMFRGKSK